MEGYLGEVRLFGGTFAPRGWNFCDGTILPIAQYDALFALIGTIYGGDGQTTFAVPDLVGRAPVGAGQGIGLSNYTIGQQAGTDSITLVTTNLPAHNHNFTSTVTATLTPKVSNTATGNTDAASGNYLSVSPTNLYDTAADTAMAPMVFAFSGGVTASVMGGSQPHSNLQPRMGMQYIICTEGIFPSRN